MVFRGLCARAGARRLVRVISVECAAHHTSRRAVSGAGKPAWSGAHAGAALGRGRGQQSRARGGSRAPTRRGRALWTRAPEGAREGKRLAARCTGALPRKGGSQQRSAAPLSTNWERSLEDTVRFIPLLSSIARELGAIWRTGKNAGEPQRGVARDDLPGVLSKQHEDDWLRQGVRSSRREVPGEEVLHYIACTRQFLSAIWFV